MTASPRRNSLYAIHQSMMLSDSSIPMAWARSWLKWTSNLPSGWFPCVLQIGIYWAYFGKACTASTHACPLGYDLLCLFNHFAEALHWILVTNYHVKAIHYRDDFLLVGAACQDQCVASVRVTLSVCERLGISVAFDKLEGPSTRITFLGIVLDSEAQSLSLSQDKLAEILHQV